MPNVPKPKPYSEEDFKKDADKFIKGYLGGFDKGEMNQFLKRSVDKIENSGVMSSDEAKDFIKERAFYLKEFAKENKGETLPELKATGGRIGFLEGGTKYNAMVTKMYIEAGGQKGTGMDIDSFAEKYFPKMAQGGRIGYSEGSDDYFDEQKTNVKGKKTTGPVKGGKTPEIPPEEFQKYLKYKKNKVVKAATGGRIGFRGGDAAKSDAASGRDAGRSSPSGGADDRSSEAQTAAHNAAVAAAQAANKAAEEKMNMLNTLSRFRPNTFVNPNNYSVNLNKNIGPFGLNVGINTLGMLGVDDPRTPEDESELDDYGISAGFNTDLLGGNLNLGAGYNPTTGTNFGLNFSKQFNQGGRVNYNEGSLDPDTLALKEKIEEIMDIEGVGFGEAFKQAMRELASQSKE